MNEKFKLLALEAKMGTADFDAGSYYVATPDKMQKLCELIVRECIEQASIGNGGNNQWDKRTFASKIKEIQELERRRIDLIGKRRVDC
jgi:hypothetical protein